MKWFVPLVLLAAMFAAGCATPEDNFMAGTPPPADKPAVPVASAATLQKPTPFESKTNIMTITPAFTLPSDPAPAATKADVAAVAPVMAKKQNVKKTTAPKTAIAPAAPVLPVIVTPDNSLAGKVLAYNSSGHFVVLEFPAGPMPNTDQILFLYRAGLKVAQVKITGPERDNNTVADLVSGDAQTGDEVRDQ